MKITRLLIAVSVSVTTGFANCSTKNLDADIKTNIEARLKTVPGGEGVIVDVMNGIVTITGECKDKECSADCEKIAQDVKGVKTVINDLMVTSQTEVPVTVPVTAPAIAQEMAEPNDPLTKSVADIIKKYPTVKAEVNDGIVTLSGEIKKPDLPKLMKAISSLKPKKIEKKLTVKNNSKKKPQKHKKKSKKR